VKERVIYTFGDSVLDFSTFKNNVMVVDTFFFFDEGIVVTIFRGGFRRRVNTSSELNFGNEKPLEKSKNDSNDSTSRNQNLSTEIWENYSSHGGKRRRRVWENETK
jgi:hypothetical protein